MLESSESFCIELDLVISIWIEKLLSSLGQKGLVLNRKAKPIKTVLSSVVCLETRMEV